MDRLGELVAFMDELPSSSSNGDGVGDVSGGRELSRNDSKPSGEAALLGEFHSLAFGISNQITKTSAKLEKLTGLVKRKSLFNDPKVEIERYVEDIGRDLKVLNSRLGVCDQFLKDARQPLSSKGKGSHTEEHTQVVVETLKANVTDAAKDFKKILLQRTDAIKEQGDRRKKFGKVGGLADMTKMANFNKTISLVPNERRQAEAEAVAVTGGGKGGSENVRKDGLPRPGTFPAKSSNGNSGEGGGFGGGSMTAGMGYIQSKYASELKALDSLNVQEAEEQVSNPNKSLVRKGLDLDSATFVAVVFLRSSFILTRQVALLPAQQQALTPFEMAQLEMENGGSQSQLLIPQTSNYLEDRSNAVAQIESHISELGTVFNRLAGMVSEHQELVQRVTDNVDQTSDNVSSGITSLTNTLESLKSNKMLFMKVMAIITVFIVFFVTVLA